MLEPIKAEEVQRLLTTFENKPVYLHVETTNGAYAIILINVCLMQVRFTKYTSHI